MPLLLSFYKEFWIKVSATPPPPPPPRCILRILVISLIVFSPRSLPFTIVSFSYFIISLALFLINFASLQLIYAGRYFVRAKETIPPVCVYTVYQFNGDDGGKKGLRSV